MLLKSHDLLRQLKAQLLAQQRAQLALMPRRHLPKPLWVLLRVLQRLAQLVRLRLLWGQLALERAWALVVIQPVLQRLQA